jgi:hypothetical protein
VPDWSKLTLALAEVDIAGLLGGWAWLVDRPVNALGMTRFGDWFLEDERGAVHRLDLLEGTFSEVCASVVEYEARRARDDELVDWFQDGMVYALYGAGDVPGRGQGFGYRLPPILGGAVTRDNVVVVDMESWQPFMAQVHQQVRRLPEGARVGGVHLEPDGTVKLEVMLDS